MPNFKLEMKKFWRSKKLILLLLICIIIPSAIFYWNHSNLDRYANDLSFKMANIGASINSTRMEYQNTMREAGLTPSEMPLHMTYFEKLSLKTREFNILYSELLESRYDIPSHMLAFYQAYLDYVDDRTTAGQAHLFTLYDGDFERVESEKAFFQELVDRGLPYEDPTYTNYGFNFSKSVMDITFGLVLALFLILMATDIFSEEKTNNTENIRLIQPVKRFNVLIAKMSASMVYVLLFITLTFLVSYLLAGILGTGFGSIYYPVQSASDLISAGISMGEYIALAALYFCLYLLVLFACIALFSAVVKDTAIVAVLAVFTAIIGSSVKSSYLNPFSYLDFEHLIIKGQSHPLLIIGVGLATSAFIILLTHYLSRTTWVQSFTLEPRAKDGGKTLGVYEKKRSWPAPYFRFEILKIIKRRATIIPFILLLILVTVVGLNKYIQYEEIRILERDNYQMRSERAQDSLAMYDQMIAADESLSYENFSEAISQANNQIDISNRAIDALNAGDITGVIESKGDQFQHSLNIWRDDYPDQARDVFLAKLDEIKERQVHPVLSGAAWELEQALVTSPFVVSSDIRDGEDLNAQPSTTYIANSLLKDGLGILALAVFAISLALGFSDETQDTRTIYLLNTQPLQRRKIYFGKLLAQSVVFLIMVSLLAVVPFIGLRFSGSPTETNFPAVQYLNEITEDYENERLLRMHLTENRGRDLSESASAVVGYTFRDMIDENAEMAAMLIISGLGILAFAMLISQAIRHKIGVSLGTVLIFGLGYLASRYALNGAGFLPFIWLDTPLVATGEASMIFDKTNMTSWSGAVVLTLWLIAFVVLGYAWFRKRGRYQ